MKNKKDLNIWLLVISLITVITILLPFAKTLEIADDLTLWIKIVFYGTISVFIACLTLISVISLTCLIKDKYQPIKFIEFFVLLGFLMVFINVVTFACSDFKLTPGYAVMALEAFIMSAFSQSGRLFTAFPNFGKDFISIFKKESDENEPEEPKKDKKKKGFEATPEPENINNEKMMIYDESLEEKTTPAIVEKITPTEVAPKKERKTKKGKNKK